jgi:hypothetical protein
MIKAWNILVGRQKSQLGRHSTYLLSRPCCMYSVVAKDEISVDVYYFTEYSLLCSPNSHTTEGEIQETCNTEVYSTQGKDSKQEIFKIKIFFVLNYKSVFFSDVKSL